MVDLEQLDMSSYPSQNTDECENEHDVENNDNENENEHESEYEQKNDLEEEVEQSDDECSENDNESENEMYTSENEENDEEDDEDEDELSEFVLKQLAKIRKKKKEKKINQNYVPFLNRFLKMDMKERIKAISDRHIFEFSRLAQAIVSKQINIGRIPRTDKWVLEDIASGRTKVVDKKNQLIDDKRIHAIFARALRVVRKSILRKNERPKNEHRQQRQTGEAF